MNYVSRKFSYIFSLKTFSDVHFTYAIFLEINKILSKVKIQEIDGEFSVEQNLKALNQLLTEQKLAYDFGVYQISFDVDLPFLILSPGISNLFRVTLELCFFIFKYIYIRILYVFIEFFRPLSRSTIFAKMLHPRQFPICSAARMHSPCFASTFSRPRAKSDSSTFQSRLPRWFLRILHN